VEPETEIGISLGLVFGWIVSGFLGGFT